MTRPQITKSSKGMLGKVYYKKSCDQRGWDMMSGKELARELEEIDGQ